MIGPPASLDNALMALSAGSTSLGNLAQYYTFDLLYEKSDIPRTSGTIQAIALAAAQPVEILIHSNIEDSFAALFTDLSSCLGLVMVEQYIVGELLGATVAHCSTVAHCYGQTFSDSFKRLAFQRALRRLEPDAGTMFVCNTSGYGPDEAVNYAVLASDLSTDMIAQRLGPTPHALVPIPVTEYARIPDIEEIVAVHKFAHRLRERLDDLLPLIDVEPADRLADTLIEGGTRFKDNLLRGLETAGIDTANPVELLLAIRRLGAKRLEAYFGAGDSDPDRPRGRRPVVAAATLSEIERMRDETLAAIGAAEREAIASRDLVACVASTDVHEWGKLLVESVFGSLGVRVVDGGVNADPDALAELARRETVDFIALSTHNGIALTYVSRLREEMILRELTLPVFVGGRLNQVPDGSNTSLPVDVSDRLSEAGVAACASVDEMLSTLADEARRNQSPA